MKKRMSLIQTIITGYQAVTSKLGSLKNYISKHLVVMGDITLNMNLKMVLKVQMILISLNLD